LALKRTILEALADDCSLAILNATMDRACSAMEIVHGSALPPSTVYRRVNEFVNAGLLTVERIMVTEEGKKFSLYRSTLRDIHVEYRSGQVDVNISVNEDAVGKLSRLWSSMRMEK